MEKPRKSYNLLAGIIVLLAVVVTVAMTGYIVSRPEPPVIQGQAEATEYRVSGKVPGRIGQFYAGEGDFVHKGDTLVEIDSPEVRARGKAGTDSRGIRAVAAGSCRGGGDEEVL